MADDIKKSPKGYTITLERVPGTKATYTAPKTAPNKKEVVEEPKTVTMKNKKKNLDDLLESGMI